MIHFYSKLQDYHNIHKHHLDKIHTQLTQVQFKRVEVHPKQAHIQLHCI